MALLAMKVEDFVLWAALLSGACLPHPGALQSGHLPAQGAAWTDDLADPTHWSLLGFWLWTWKSLPAICSATHSKLTCISVDLGNFSFLRDIFSWSFFLVNLKCAECFHVCSIITKETLWGSRVITPFTDWEGGECRSSAVFKVRAPRFRLCLFAHRLRHHFHVGLAKYLRV